MKLSARGWGAAAGVAVLLAGAFLVVVGRATTGPMVGSRSYPWRQAPVLGSCQVGLDRRACWRFDAPGALTWSAAVPPNGKAHLSLAAAKAGSVRLTVGEGAVAVRHEWPVDGEGWRDHVVDLGGSSGKVVTLRLDAGGAGEVRVAATLSGREGPRPLPNVILYVVDCLRADHVGAYGYGRPTTPVLDGLAREGVVFERVLACASWTKPSTGCLFTSMYPWDHGARTLPDALRSDAPTLAEVFLAQGYTTAAWVANPFVGSSRFGLTRGFERVVQTTELADDANINDIAADAADITRPVVDWLARNRDRRFFLYLHSLDLHEGYRRRPPFAQVFVDPSRRGAARLVDLYDNELAYNDREIGRLLEALAAAGIGEETIVAVTADHGEEFGEHGVPNHGHSLYQGVLHVPFIVRMPGGSGAGRRVPALASNLDIGPTLLDLAGIDAPALGDGRSLAPAIGDPGREVRDVVLAEQVSSKEILYAAVNERFKLIRQLVPEARDLLFDVVADPGETRNLLPEVPEGARGLDAEVAATMRRGLGGYGMALAAGPAETFVVELAAQGPGRILTVQHVPIRIGDQLDLPADGTRATFSFTGERRHLVVRTEPPDATLLVRARTGSRALGVADVALGRDGRPPTALPFLLEATGLLVTPDQAASLGDRPGTGLRAWYVAPPPARPVPIDPELEQQLRALGYIQ